MDKTIMVCSGRNFTTEEIDLIKWTRNCERKAFCRLAERIKKRIMLKIVCQ